MNASGGGRFEEIGSYVRAKRVGPFVFVAGTTAIEPSGRLYAPGNTYAQTRYAIARIEQALKSVDAELRHVTRTRAFLADMAHRGRVRARPRRDVRGHPAGGDRGRRRPRHARA